MFQKIESKDAEQIARKTHLLAWPMNPFNLAFECYTESVNGEQLIYERDALYRNDFPLLGLPRNKANWPRTIMICATEEDIKNIEQEKIEIKEKLMYGKEYYYKTKAFTDLENKDFRRRVKQFQRNYEYSLKTDYPKEKILQFLDAWKEQQTNKNILFENGFQNAVSAVHNKDAIRDGKWIFIEIEGKLAGYNVSYQLTKDFWVGIHQKVDYQYKGLSRFLLYQRALQFKNVENFSLGTEAEDPGMQKFKEELGPHKTVDQYFVITKDRK